jgi:hypothetical protein
MESVPGAVPQNTARVCHLTGCDRPVVRHNRKYCSRHRYFADIDYMQKLWERPDVRAAREATRQLNDLERLMTPLRRTEAALKDVDHATRILRSFFSKAPTPSRLSLFQQEAREAWEGYYRGDPYLLDLFIRKYIVRLKNTDGPVPIKLRLRVKRLLDSCFAPVKPFYAPGEWFLFNQGVWIKLNLLVLRSSILV